MFLEGEGLFVVCGTWEAPSGPEIGTKSYKKDSVALLWYAVVGRINRMEEDFVMGALRRLRRCVPFQSPQIGRPIHIRRNRKFGITETEPNVFDIVPKSRS